MKCIFYIVPMEKFGEVAVVFFTECWPQRHQTLHLSIRCALVSGRGEGSTGHSASDAGWILLAHPVMPSAVRM